MVKSFPTILNNVGEGPLRRTALGARRRACARHPISALSESGCAPIQLALRLRVRRIRRLRMRTWLVSVRRLRASLRLRRLRWREAGLIDSPYGRCNLPYGRCNLIDGSAGAFIGVATAGSGATT